ncbi:MAG: hypothetical protein MUE33_02960 [Cytophagaceae bacterium]|jgi:hypothetical protein|nr:hypothetical protein [Cytophagaceae bacterium]
MIETKIKGITFLTRHYPPSLNINGESVSDLVSWLQQHKNIPCRILTIDREADGLGGAKKESVGEVIRIKTLFNNKKSIFRFLSFLYDGFILAKKAKKYEEDLIVVTTSPPLLPMWASIIFKKNMRWALWSLDLFPEGFMVTGRIKASNFFYKWCLKKSYSLVPDLLISLGPKQGEYLQQNYQSNITETILPCGVFFLHDINTQPPEWYVKDKIIIGYCGNVHDAHNPDFLKRVIDHIHPDKHLLVLALYGSKSQEVLDYANGKQGVKVTLNVPRNQLHFIDIHMVTLRNEWTHIAVPSKAVSAISMGCPILFCGNPESDNWHLLQNAGWHIPENNSLDISIQRFFETLTIEAIQSKKLAAQSEYIRLKSLVHTSYELIAQFSQKE